MADKNTEFQVEFKKVEMSESERSRRLNEAYRNLMGGGGSEIREIEKGDLTEVYRILIDRAERHRKQKEQEEKERPCGQK